MLTVTLIVVLVVVVAVASMSLTRRTRGADLEQGPGRKLAADATSPVSEAERGAMEDRPGAH